VNDLRDTCQPDGAADRAASAARTLAAIAHNAARKHVEGDVVAPQTDGADANVMPARHDLVAGFNRLHRSAVLDAAERERQARLRRWQTPPLPNRKGG
jgi:hypothetical protein